MAILSVNNLYKSYNGNVILDDISFTINKNDKVAIVGDNGEGKTTLLKILTKEIEADKGNIYIDDNNVIGYLSQNIINDVSNTLLEEMESAFLDLLKIAKEMNELVDKMAIYENKQYIERYSYLQELYLNKGGYEYQYQIKQMLNKFGFDESYYQRTLKSFSGGERTRVAFAKLLLKNPSILLLDEPTNHLDLAMIEWLEKYLKSYSGTIVLVSHDQVFIDNIVTKIIEIENHKATMYTGNYSTYVIEKQQNYEHLLKSYKVQEKEIKRYEMLIRKFKKKPTKTSFAQRLKKKLDKMEKIELPKIKKKNIHAKLESNLSPYNVKLHVCENLLFGYNNVALTEPLNLLIKNQDKICIMGKNGSGKTTMLKCIMQNENKISGFNNDLRDNIKYFYFDQTQEILNPDLTLFDTIHDEFPLMNDSEVRNILGRFLFSDDEVFKYNSDLSGGEKIRLIFAIISLRNYDILYLDEPTNHLDFTTKRVISDILEDYPGTIVMVSHDRYFVNRVANKIIYLMNKKFIIEDGNYDHFISLHDLSSDSINFMNKKDNIKAKPQNIINKNNKNLTKEKIKLEQKLEMLLNELDELNNNINDDKEYNWIDYQNMQKQIENKEQEIDELIKKLESYN